jgi:hypothetical protein
MPSPRDCVLLQHAAVEGEAIPTCRLQRRGFSQRTSSKRAKSVSVE